MECMAASKADLTKASALRCRSWADLRSKEGSSSTAGAENDSGLGPAADVTCSRWMTSAGLHRHSSLSNEDACVQSTRTAKL